MSDKINKIIMLGILLCLFIIAIKPTSTTIFDNSMPSSLSVDISNEKIFQIGGVNLP